MKRLQVPLLSTSLNVAKKEYYESSVAEAKADKGGLPRGQVIVELVQKYLPLCLCIGLLVFFLCFPAAVQNVNACGALDWVESGCYINNFTSSGFYATAGSPIRINRQVYIPLTIPAPEDGIYYIFDYSTYITMSHTDSDETVHATHWCCERSEDLPTVMYGPDSIFERVGLFHAEADETFDLWYDYISDSETVALYKAHPYPCQENGGAPCSVGINECKRDGEMVCSPDMMSLVCSVTTPGDPSPEICDGLDNDCNGAVDDGVPPRQCYSGPFLTEGFGICKAGTQSCTNGQWGIVCEGEVLPKAEVCGTNSDNNCNGIKDDGCDKSCKDTMPVGSSVNMATGNLSHEQALYQTLKAVLPLDISLTYNSVEGDGALGKGWTHSYNIAVSQGSDGGYIYTEANSRRTALYLSGTQYKPLGFEYPTLTVNTDGTYNLRQNENIVYNFNSSGKLTGIQDKFSNSIAFTYTADNLTGISDSQGRSLSLVYNADNRIETITDPNGNIHSFVYEGINLVNVSTLTTDLQTLTWTYTYTPDGRMETKSMPMGYMITYGYDYQNGRLAWVMDNENNVRFLTFDHVSSTATIDKEVIQGENDEVSYAGGWIYTYDPATGKLATKTDPEGYTTTYAYGTNTETVTDAKGNITESVYDSKENLLSKTEKSATDPVGRTTVYTYNADNEILTSTDPEGHVTTYTYETNDGDKIVRVKDAANEETETRYYADGRMKALKNAKGQTTTFTYAYASATHRTTETTTDFLGVSTSRVYDLSGNMIESWDAFGTVTKYEYNSLNQLKTTKDYLDNVMNTYEYWADGNMKTTTDAYGNQTQYKYNYDGKVTEVKDALGNTTPYIYGAGTGCQTCSGGGDNLVSVTDANSKTTTYEYFKNGWKKNQKDPLNHVTSYTYDPAGFMTSLTDPALAVTAFDKTDLVTTKTDPLGRVTTYEYDKAGRLKTKTDRKGDVIHYSYTQDNVLETITYPDNSTVSFTNDELDRTTSIRDSLGITTYIYDDANRTVTVTDPHGFVVVYKNDEAGRLKELTYPGNKKVIYGYDKLNRMETVRLDWLNQTATYHYDAAGRLDYLENFNGTVADYGYDSANRLASLVNKKADNSIISSYSFPVLDGVGNRVQAVVNEPLIAERTPENTAYTYNDKKNRIETAGPDGFTHDLEGQISTGYNAAYTFDYEHRLKTAAVSGQQSAFSYDGQGNRLKAVRNGETTYYIYDMNGNVLAEADGNKNITGLYIQGQGLLAMVSPNDQVYSYHFNAIGSTVAMTDHTQNVVNKYVYDSFGFVLNQVETVPQPFKYVGQYGVMAESCALNADCFLYMRARYYDPKVGRFVSEDPIGFDGGTVNLYEYVGNQPVNKIDPTGLTMAGLPNLVNPGAYPNPSKLIEQFKWFNWVAMIEAMNAASDAVFMEARNLDCDKQYDYYIYYGTSPIRFIGISPTYKYSYVSADAIKVLTTIKGTKNCNCPNLFK